MKRVISVFRWLLKTPSSSAEPQRRRERLLAWLLLILLLLIIVSLILMLLVNAPNTVRRTDYSGLILGLFILIMLAYGLNRAGHYTIAAGLTVVCSVFGPWGSLLLDPPVLHGDLIPLTYVVISVLLSSILLQPTFTIALAVLQFTTLGILFLSTPDIGTVNWPSFLAFFFSTSIISVLSSIISKYDLKQIDRQTHQLILSEAELREQSIRDHLTTLFNRRYLDETLVREVRRADRTHKPIGIIMLDIDHFKHFNDALGHAAGDALLRELGKLLREQVRGADIACRYGGEEFVLVLPDASIDVTLARAELIRGKVKHLHENHKTANQGVVTISAGVAVFPEHGATAEAILKSADDALYQAKREGRDRVVVADTAKIDG